MKNFLAVGVSIILAFLLLVQSNAVLAASVLTSISVGLQTGSLTSGAAGSATYVVTVNRSGSGNIDNILSVTTSLPTGVTALFSPGTVSFTGNTPTSNTSTLTLTSTIASPAGSTIFTVQALGNGVTKTADGNLLIDAAPADIIDPVLTLPSDITAEATDSTGAVVSFSATATDETAPANPTVTCVSASGSTFPLGETTVECSTTDAAGNTTTGDFKVTVVDTTAPVITLDGSNPQTVLVGQSYDEGGATVSDDVDTGLSATINSSAVNTSALGSYSVTYNAVDSAGNTATEVIRTVNVVDQEVPVITLTGANPQLLEVGTSYSELGATVADNVDTGLSAVIDASAVISGTLGSYSVTYNATDLSENSANQVTRTVNVVDTTAPIITLAGDATVNLTVGDSYSDVGATATDNYDDLVTVVTAGSVDTNTVGAYFLTYNAEDSSDNDAEQVTRTVNVVEAIIDVCPNIEGDQVTLPEGKVILEGQCVDEESEPEPEPENPTIEQVNSSRGSTGFIGSVIGGQVLGASTGPDGSTGLSCPAYINGYIRFGANNSIEDVALLQIFLNEHERERLAVTGVYGQATFDAVKRFQTKNEVLILKPWVDVGIPVTGFPTGVVYKTTIWAINNIVCGQGAFQIPLLP